MVTEKELVALLQRSIDAHDKAVAENDRIESDFRAEQFWHWSTMVEMLTGKRVHCKEKSREVYLREVK